MKMDFLAGLLFGVGVTGIGCILLASRSMNAISERMAALEYAVQARPGRKPLDDADWWKDGSSRYEEDEFD